MKKIGSDTPARATPMENRSNRVPRLSAEITPIATPPTSHRIAAPMASEMVTGRLLTICGQTGCSDLKEYPKHGGGQ